MAWTTDEAQALLGEVFAPWVQALALRVSAIEETGARFVLPGNPELSRGGGAGGGVVCGQAIGAAADTCSVVALSALNGAFRPCTTVDMTTHFLRPLPDGEAEITVTALSNGRRMATTRVDVRGLVDGAPGKLSASATCAFAYLDL
ncbi:MAG: PaaI family thioesterase [Pseudomonadota bacterium]